MLQILLLGVLQAIYKGGVEAFNKDFGIFSSKDGKVFISPRDGATLSDEAIAKVQEICDSHGASLILTETCNFSGMTEEEAGERFSQDVGPILKELDTPLNIQASTAILEIECPELKKGSDEGSNLLSALEGLHYLSNISITFKDESVLILDGEREATEEEKVQAKKYSKLCTGRPDRETIINDDDIMNIVIALGQAETVEEFLELV